MRQIVASLAVLVGITAAITAQITTGEILGAVHDPSAGIVAGARLTVRNMETNGVREAISDEEGRFRFPQLPIGPYEISVEKSGFAKYVQGPILLRLNQDADLRISLQLAGVSETITVSADAPLLNTNNAEVGVNFDRKRISELPLAPDRNVLKLALSVAGVSQLQGGQRIPGYIEGTVPFSVNGMRVESSNFMIDGQDSNNSVFGGQVQAINNPDTVAEFRLLTNQFAPEYGRAAGSAANIITKSGTNQPHGSLFWFHNDNHLNSRSNLDKALFSAAPFRTANQAGGTLGGPIVKDNTFFFASLERWTDHRLASGARIRGVPTEEGRALLNSLAGDRTTVQALLENLPAAQTPVPRLAAPLALDGRQASIPLGILSGFVKAPFDDWQWSARVDHRFNDRHSVGFRYLYDDESNLGNEQANPPGLSTNSLQRTQSASAFLNSTLSSSVYHDVRLSYQRLAIQDSGPPAPAPARIPSIEVPELGLNGNVSGPTRTAIGLATQLPRTNFDNNYQLQETLGVLRGAHSLKFGLDFRRLTVSTFFPKDIRGRLVYPTLQDLVDDRAQTATITSPLAGGDWVQHYDYDDFFFFLQDEFRVRPNFTLTYGVRYESPGNPFENLRRANQGIVAAAGGDQRFTYAPVPPRDTNNWAPRFGFNYRFDAAPGLLHALTGDEKLVLRGGYARTYDFAFLNIARTVANGFPFVKSNALPAGTPNSLEVLRTAAAAPIAGNPGLQSQTLVGADFRSPFAEQFALQFQREIRNDWVLSIGYVGTKGTALFQTVDGNPVIPGTRRRVDPARGVVQMRCNCTSSTYHSLQTSLEKRLSKNFSMAAHYTWSAFIDGSSDTFPGISSNADVGIPQDAFDRRAERARSAFDRPQRFVTNGVFELPFARAQHGLAGKLFGGWQVSGFLTFQSGAPFTVLDGADPGNRVSPLATTVRANLNTTLDLAHVSVPEILQAGGGALFSHVTAAGPLGNIGRNILRSDGIKNLDLGVFKNTRILESQIIQFRAEFYNISNTRNFGIPDARLSSANFLNQWGTDGGNRRIVLALRYVF